MPKQSKPPMTDGVLTRCPTCTYTLSLELDTNGKVSYYCYWCEREEIVSKEPT